MHVLRPGGLLFIQTHNAFPLHGYPFDYYRFSQEALRALFPAAMGFHVLETDYEFPCRIVSERDPSLQKGKARSFLNVRLYGTKRETTPEHWVYELGA